MTQPITLEIEKIAGGGYTLARHEGRVIFVPYVLPGERVTVRLTNQAKNFAHAAPLEVLDPAPQRVPDPPCPHFGTCGGCQWQHAEYTRQLELKYDMVLDHFQRIGKFEAPPLEPIIASPEPWHYRRNATFYPLQGGHFGYYDDANQTIIDLDTCLIVHPSIMETLLNFEPDDETITRLTVVVGSDAADVMVVLETKDDLPPSIQTDLPISVNFLLSDNEPVNLIGKSHVTYDVYGHSFRMTAGAFFRASLEATRTLIDEVLYRLNLQGVETLLELYSGVGLFTAFLAEKADLVVSVESYPPAVTDADFNLSAFENVDLVEGPVDEVLRDLTGPFDAALLDPPRAGLSEAATEALLRLRPSLLVYVSRDATTLARDARALVEGGYHLAEVQPLDSFPQTAHVEIIATFAL
jgi:23S rRNA (uracil1939-C5)-methyltransferase